MDLIGGDPSYLTAGFCKGLSEIRFVFILMPYEMVDDHRVEDEATRKAAAAGEGGETCLLVISKIL